ncbi:MAG: protein kinase domain-containing protein, partial [Bryobacteraceae bacterium]
MLRHQWRQVEEMYQRALGLEASLRAPFLEAACGDDEDLRRDVEALLAYQGRGRAAAGVGGSRASGGTLGERIGPYELVALLDSSGISQVYRARDGRLAREVAIKILPAAFAADEERLRRYQREAHTAGQLNHPNVLTIYQVGTHEGSPYLVSELLEGNTLRSRLAVGQLAVPEAARIALETAQGLHAVHSKKIVHRDLRPENLFLTTAGHAKILDFGLARLAHPLTGSSYGSTRLGSVLATAGYLSPEQVSGKAVDHRSDIFSLGVLLYEMLAGAPPFAAASPLETMRAVLNDRPARLSQHNPRVPLALERLVDRCLEKDPDLRYSSADQVAADLATLVERRRSDLARIGATTQRPATRRERLVWSVAAVAVLAVLVTWAVQRRTPAGRATRVYPLTNHAGSELRPSLSPDGASVAFSWNGPRRDNYDIYIQPVNGATSTRLTINIGRDDGPAWSPDGRTIAFVRNPDAEGALFLV